jgi:hypothetical protein
MIQVATGEYISILSQDGVEIFVIINEPNCVGLVEMQEAISYLEKLADENNLREMDMGKLELDLEEKYFEKGVKIIQKVKAGYTPLSD